MKKLLQTIKFYLWKYEAFNNCPKGGLLGTAGRPLAQRIENCPILPKDMPGEIHSFKGGIVTIYCEPHIRPLFRVYIAGNLLQEGFIIESKENLMIEQAMRYYDEEKKNKYGLWYLYIHD